MYFTHVHSKIFFEVDIFGRLFPQNMEYERLLVRIQGTIENFPLNCFKWHLHKKAFAQKKQITWKKFGKKPWGSSGKLERLTKVDCHGLEEQ